jgi:hypothetical protein
MSGVNPNGNGQQESARKLRVHNDGKRWAQDLVLEEIGGNEARDLNMDELERAANINNASKNWIWALIGVVVIAGGVAAGVVLSQGKEAPPPTPQPTPEPTPSPTFAPTSPPTSFMNLLPPYSLEIAESDPASPQARALTWLQEDPQFNEFAAYRLLQRYALAVLYYSTNGDSWENRTGWLSNDSECSWYNDNKDMCDESFRLHTFWLGANDLEGTIPTELELLTDVMSMVLIDDLSGEIPSAMYVS